MTNQDTNPTVPQMPTEMPDAGQHKDWRVGYASAVLIGVLVLGFLVLTPNIYFESTPWLTLVFFAVYAASVAAIAWRGTVPLKIAAAVAVLGASGIAAILGGASPTNGTFFFVALVTVVALLRSPRSGAVATAITLIVVAIVAGLSGVGLLGTGPRAAALQSPAGWIGAALAVLLFGAALVLGITHLQRSAGPPIAGERLPPVDADRGTRPVSAQLTDRRSEWLEKALETARKLNASQDPRDSAGALATAVRDVFGYVDVAVLTFNVERGSLVIASHAGDAPLPAEQVSLDSDSLAARSVRSGVAQVSDSPSRAGDTSGGPGATPSPEAAIPVMRDGQAIAALRVRGADDHDFEKHEIEALGWVASQAAVALGSRQVEEPPRTELDEATPRRQPRSTRPWERLTSEAAIEYAYGDADLPETAPEMKVPLSLRDEEIGSISLATDADWSAEEQSLVEAVATQAALALENARLMEASQLAASREHTLAEITAKVWGAATLEGVLRTAVQELAQAFGADRAIIELRTDTDHDG
jgi:GAF domain-containing protein